MKLDAEPPYDSSDPAFKMTSDCNKQFPSDIPKLDDRGRRIEQDVMLDAIEGKVCESIDLSQTCNGSNAFYLSGKSDPINNCKNESDSRAEDMIYMDKTVTDVQLPHLAASTKASPSIKDICIDEGVQMFEKILAEYDKVDEAAFSSSNFSRVNDNSALMEETIANENPEDLKPISTNEELDSLGKILERDVGDKETFLVAEYPVKQCNFSSSVSERKSLDTTEITSCALPYEEVTDHRSHILEEFNSDLPQVDSSIHNDGTSEKQDLGKKLNQVVEEEEDLTTMAASSPDKAKESKPTAGTVSSNKDLFEEKTSEFVVISNETKSTRIDNTNGTSDDPKIDAVAHTSDLESGDASIVDNENKVVSNQQSVQSQNCVETEEPVSDGTTSARSSFSHLSHDDLNPHGPPNISGSITSSHIQHSGNISHRSESSTTSAQSFAFPVLQPEWSSSPVRMAKADRRHLRKHRWRTALTCCKF